jgi:hypothetical protein
MADAGDRPRCKCHDLPMYWHKDLRKASTGGYWQCAERQRTRIRTKYQTDPEWREKQRARLRAMYQTDPAFRERKIEAERERKDRLREQGLCTDCGAPTLTDWHCWDCLNKREDRRGIA